MLQSYVTSSALNERLNDYASKSEIPTKTSQLTNDSEFLTEHQDISGLATKAEVSAVSAKLPEVLTEDGTYTLKATVLNGSVTYSWVKEA